MGRRMMERPSRAWEVTQIWGGNVQKSEVFAGTFEVGIGDQAGCDLPLALEGRHVLLRGDASSVVLSVPKGASGVVAAPSGTIELLGDAEVDVVLGDEGRAILELAGMEILVRATEAPEKIEGAMPFAWREHRFTAASLGLHLAFLVGVLLVPPTAMSLSLDRADMRSRIASIASAPPEEVVPDWMSKVAAPVQGSNEGQAMEGDEGAAGDPTETHRNRQLQRQGPRDNPNPAISKLSTDQVRTSGIIGILSAGQFDPTGSIYGLEGVRGRDEVTSIGNLVGDSFGPAFGPGGWGMQGTGRGGCPAGTPPELCGQGTVGVGSLSGIGTIGGCSAERFAQLTRDVGRARALDMCSGGHDGIGIGRPDGGRPRPDVVPGIRPLPVELAGGLSKEAIRRTVRAHMNEIRHCYEQGLASQPDLEGRVSVGFTVRGDGAVLSSRVASSSLRSPTVEQCMSTAVRRWSFPASENGGTTVVTYPFVVVRAEGN